MSVAEPSVKVTFGDFDIDSGAVSVTEAVCMRDSVWSEILSVNVSVPLWGAVVDCVGVPFVIVVVPLIEFESDAHTVSDMEDEGENEKVVSGDSEPTERLSDFVSRPRALVPYVIVWEGELLLVLESVSVVDDVRVLESSEDSDAEPVNELLNVDSREALAFVPEKVSEIDWESLRELESSSLGEVVRSCVMENVVVFEGSGDRLYLVVLESVSVGVSVRLNVRNDCVSLNETENEPSCERLLVREDETW